MTLSAANLVGTVRPFWLAYLDFDGDPLRVTTLPADFTPTGTGDPDLDDLLFVSLPASLVEITPVTNAEDGSDQVEITLSGIPGPDDDLLDAIDSPALWRGRVFRLWRGLADSDYAPTLLEAYHTGYLMSLRLRGSNQEQTIAATTESYLALLTTPRARTYQDQGEHDATDITPSLIRAAANGIQSAVGGGNPFLSIINDPNFVRTPGGFNPNDENG